MSAVEPAKTKRYAARLLHDFAEHLGTCSDSESYDDDFRVVRVVVDGPAYAATDDGGACLMLLDEALEPFCGTFGCPQGSHYCRARHVITALSATVADADEPCTPLPSTDRENPAGLGGWVLRRRSASSHLHRVKVWWDDYWAHMTGGERRFAHRHRDALKGRDRYAGLDHFLRLDPEFDFP
jgi:hypothetical protein